MVQQAEETETGIQSYKTTGVCGTVYHRKEGTTVPMLFLKGTTEVYTGIPLNLCYL